MIKAKLLFDQRGTMFGADRDFQIYISGIGSVLVSGNKLTEVSLLEVGDIKLQAHLDEFSSRLTSLFVADGDIVYCTIQPPDGQWNRSFRLFGNTKEYLKIKEIKRV